MEHFLKINGVPVPVSPPPITVNMAMQHELRLSARLESAEVCLREVAYWLRENAPGRALASVERFLAGGQS